MSMEDKYKEIHEKLRRLEQEYEREPAAPGVETSYFNGVIKWRIALLRKRLRFFGPSGSLNVEGGIHPIKGITNNRSGAFKL